MIRKTFSILLKTSGVALLLFVLLFADGIGATSFGFIGSFLREITAVCRDMAIQWMLVFCLAGYFIIFLVLERRLHGSQRPEARGQKAANTEAKTLTSPRLSPLPARAERER